MEDSEENHLKLPENTFVRRKNVFWKYQAISFVIFFLFGSKKLKNAPRTHMAAEFEPPRLNSQLFGVKKYENSWRIELKFFWTVRNREEFPRKQIKVEKL